MSIVGMYVGDQKVTKAYLGSELIIGSEPVDPLALAPAEHQPVVTTQALSQWGPPSIEGSAGWWRECREGFSDTPVGGQQTATSDLDMGSEYFDYPVVPGPVVAHPANPGGYVMTEFKPGGESQNARWLFNLRFVTSSPTVELRFRSAVANPDLGLVLVNGQRIQERTVTQTLGEAGIGYSTTLTFPDSRERTITIYGLNHVSGNFGGVAVEAGHAVARPVAQSGKTIAIIGDSYTNGHDTVAASETFAWRLALAMGADRILQAGIGGTGFDTGTDSFGSRVSDVLSMLPDVVILAGGRNDSTGVQKSVDEILRLLQRGGVDIFVMPTASESGQAAVRDEIRGACGATGVTYLDVAIDALDKIVDGIHPTWAAHQQLADDAFSHLEDGPPPPPPPSLVTSTVNRYTTPSMVGTSWYPSASSYPADMLLLVAQWASGSAHPLSAPEEWTELGVHTREGMSAGVWTRTVGTDYSDTDVTAQLDRIHALAQYRLSHTAAITLGAVSSQDSGQFWSMPSYAKTPGAIPLHLLCVSSPGLDAVSFTPPSGMTMVQSDLPDNNQQMGFALGATTDWTPDAALPVTTWSDTFDSDVSGWGAYGSTSAGTWVAPGVLRMESGSNVINWTVTNGDYTPGGEFTVVGRMRVVSNPAGDAEGPHVSFNFGGTEVVAHVDGWAHPVGEWGTFTTTGTVPSSFNPTTSTGNLRLGMRFSGGGQSVVEVDSVQVQAPGIGDTWTADDTSHFGIKWSLQLIPA